MVSVNITGIGWVTAAGMGRGREHQRFAMPEGQLAEIHPPIYLISRIRTSDEWINIRGWD